MTTLDIEQAKIYIEKATDEAYKKLMIKINDTLIDRPAILIKILEKEPKSPKKWYHGVTNIYYTIRYKWSLIWIIIRG